MLDALLFSCFRARDIISKGNAPIVDPTPDQYWMKLKRSKTTATTSNTLPDIPCTGNVRPDQVARHVLAMFPNVDFGESLVSCPKPFTDTHIEAFAKKSGRVFPNLASSAQKPLDKGYKVLC